MNVSCASKHSIGVWRSWLARRVWDAEVEGSSPFTPTTLYGFFLNWYKPIMPFEDRVRSIPEVLSNSKSVTSQGFSALRRDIAILAYPLFAFLLILATLATVNGLIHSAADTVASDPLFKAEENFIDGFFNILAFIVFSLYVAIMTGLLASVVTASVIAELEEHPAPLLKGLKVVTRNFGRVIYFSSLSLLLIPLGLIAQRHALRKKPHEVLGSSFSLNMAALAPAILHQKKGLFDTIRLAVGTLGQGWKENIVIKVGMYIFILIIGALSFLPELSKGYWFDQRTSAAVGWAISVLLFLSLLIASRVLASVFTASLYWRITKNNQ